MEDKIKANVEVLARAINEKNELEKQIKDLTKELDTTVDTLTEKD